eukprot:1948307-Prymnesium_polylepis.1
MSSCRATMSTAPGIWRRAAITSASASPRPSTLRRLLGPRRASCASTTCSWQGLQGVRTARP